MSNVAPPIHPSQVQGIVNGLNQRITDLEEMLHAASRNEQGSRTVMRGPEGDITKATEAAAKFMVEKFAAYETQSRQHIVELKQQQADFQRELRNEIHCFEATALGAVVATVRDTVRELLIEAKVLNSDGTAHESLRGETGAPGPVGPKGDSIVGPQGPVGKDSVVPGPPGLGREQIIELIGQIWDRTAGIYNAEKKALGDIEKRLATLESR